MSPAGRPASGRRCIAFTTIALLLLMVYIVSADRMFGLNAGRVEIGFTNSALLVMEGSDGRWHAPQLFGFPFAYSYYKNYWRPYHVSEIGRHGIFLPLWQPLLLATGLATYQWGLLRGAARLVDPLRCLGCGYSLIGLPEIPDQRCPECGRKVR